MDTNVLVNDFVIDFVNTKVNKRPILSKRPTMNMTTTMNMNMTMTMNDFVNDKNDKNVFDKNANKPLENELVVI